MERPGRPIERKDVGKSQQKKDTRQSPRRGSTQNRGDTHDPSKRKK